MVKVRVGGSPGEGRRALACMTAGRPQARRRLYAVREPAKLRHTGSRFPREPALFFYENTVRSMSDLTSVGLIRSAAPTVDVESSTGPSSSRDGASPCDPRTSD